jgi:glycosyltransferase involved in cell wall biosynthesis
MREQVMLPRRMKHDRLDLAHFLCNTAPISLPCKSVITIHDIIPCKLRCRSGSLKDTLLLNYWKQTIPHGARKADHIITVSQASKADICTTLKLPSRKVTVIPTGYHPAFRLIMDERETGRMCTRLGLTGRFVLGFASSDPRKNVSVFLTAMARVRERVHDCKVVIVCTSEDVEDEVRTLASGIIDNQTLKLLSGLSREDLAMLYNLADVVLFPSLYEGFGLPVVEAMACGTPVVTSNVSSLPEVAGDAAILINPRSPVEASDAVVKLLLNDRLHRKKTAEGIMRARSFEWHRVANSTVGVYESLFEERQRMPAAVSHSIGGEAG